MTYLTPSRDALAKALHEAMCCDDPEEIVVHGFKETADAILASDAVIDAAALADDEALVTSVARVWYDREQPPFGPLATWDDLGDVEQWRWRQSTTDNLRALAAALAERSQP